MNPAAITLLAGVITCVIGICSFVMGRMDNARKSGSMETKIEQALEGINRIDRKLEETSKTRDNVQNAIHELINYLKTKEGIM